MCVRDKECACEYDIFWCISLCLFLVCFYLVFFADERIPSPLIDNGAQFRCDVILDL